jgi:hypothetical protein
MIDHRRHHALETQKESQLNHDENDRKDNPDDGADETKELAPVVCTGFRWG